MNSIKHFAKKKRQLKFLTKKINRLIDSGQFNLMTSTARKKLIAKLKFLHNTLKYVLPNNQLKKIVAGAAILLNVSLGNVNAQFFLDPVQNPAGLAGGDNFKIPTLTDIDGDGDLDLFTIAYNGNNGQVDFFENTGTVGTPNFVSTPVANPFGIAISSLLNEEIWDFDLADMDGDGDYDMVLGGRNYVGSYYGAFFFFENTGTATAPAFAAPVVNPWGIGTVSGLAFPEIVDLDGDGDFDIYATEYYGKEFFFENTGTATAPAFSNGVENAFNLGSGQMTDFRFVKFGDFDNDGDFDAFGSEVNYSNTTYDYVFTAYYQENIGSASAPAFAAADYANNPMSFNSGDSLWAFIDLADLDNDGDMDVLMNGVEYTNNFFTNEWYYFENNGLTPTEELFGSRTGVEFYPNPADASISIKVDSDLEFTDVHIFDITGRLVEQVKLNSTSIDISHLSNGIYLLKVYSNEEFVGGNKLVKE